jgi:hypothetical protein
MRAVLAWMLLLAVAAALNTTCVESLALGVPVSGTTNTGCLYRVDLSGSTDRLWSLELLSQRVAIQVVVMDEQLVALQTLYSGRTGDGGALQETLCRRTLPSPRRLESVFFLAPLGQAGVDFSLEVFVLPKAQLFLGVPASDVISFRSHYYYFLPPAAGGVGSSPLSVAIESSDLVPDIPYQLQVSWKGCPDMTLRDSAHQVLTFTTQGRMLVLPSQFGASQPDVVYVGVRPRPQATGVPIQVFNGSDSLKNLTITVSLGDSFSSAGVAVGQWLAMLVMLSLFVLAALGVSYLVLKPGVKRLHSASSLPRSVEFASSGVNAQPKRLGDRRTRGRAKAYLWMIVLGGLFYLLPSLQTAGAEASGMLTSGNHDVCFFNELCMFPLQTFGPYGITWFAANNVISNTVYLMMAIAIFAWTMWCKWHWAEKEQVLRVLSLPHDYTLFYCLAVALFFEGLMR